MAIKTDWRQQLIFLPAALIWASILYGLLQLVTAFAFSVGVRPGTWGKDLLAHLVLALILYGMIRKWRLWVLVYTLIVTVLQICNALKIVILGSPIMPDDLSAVTNMLHLFSDWRLPLILLSILLPLASLGYAIAWRKRLTWIIFATLLVCFFAIWFQAADITRYMDRQFGDWIWNQPGNYKDRGLIMHLAHEGVRNMARGKVKITKEQVQAALLALHSSPQQLRPGADLARSPNIYIILLESFWDPMLLTSAAITPDPIDPRFRALWEQTDTSTTTAPVFGGYTANCEFEVLCGFPVTNNAVFFEGWLRNDAPCLPRYLAGAGYHSIAAHPNYAAFWNRVNSYRRIGFNEYWSQNDFEMDDMNRDFLSDKSLYRQVWKKLQEIPDSGQPELIYIVTFFGHLDYPLSASRPEVIDVGVDKKMLRAYVNQMHYKSRELMDFVEMLRTKDPEALVVMFGDHLPFLGANHDNFVQQGLFPVNRAGFDAEMFKAYVTVPLIIINGEKGPVKAGSLPMYQLPEYLLHLLGDKNEGFLHIAAHPDLQSVRPLAGLALFLPDKEEPVMCKQEEAAADVRCQKILESTRQLTILRDDLFTATRFSLESTLP